MSELATDITKRHAGYAVLDADGAIIRLVRTRQQAEEISSRLPGRKVVDVYITDGSGRASRSMALSNIRIFWLLKIE